MPLWRRAPGGALQDAVAPVAAPTPEPEPLLGDRDCSATGCAETTGVPCAYVDRRDRACATAWCPAHRDLAGGRVYCRRHAGVMRALAAGSDVFSVPDLDTRAPSLVEWVARDLDGDLRAVLMATGEGESVTSEAAHLVHAGRTRERGWERSWRLCRYTGFVHRVAVQVDEGRDTEVVVRVGHREVARLIPPWIAARQGGEEVTPAEDAQRRAHFHDLLLGAVRQGLVEETLNRP